MTLEPTDKFLVNRNGSSYSIEQQNMAELQDDDLLLVNRSNTSYKVTGKELKDSITPSDFPPKINSVTLAENTPGGDRFTNQAFTSTIDYQTPGLPDRTLGLKGEVKGLLSVVASTSAITDVQQEAIGYQIPRSLRFNSSDSAYLSRTPSVAGNRKTWTWAGWVKFCSNGDNNRSLFVSGTNSTTSTELRVLSSGYLNLVDLGATIARTNMLMRDLSAWYHVVCAFDSTQAIQADRTKLYVNGVSQSLSIASCALNLDSNINNSGNIHKIGAIYDLDPNYYLNGYLADIHFIDGQALDPSSFGAFDGNGVWKPKAYTGTYGTNGFYLPFEASDLGADLSGNGNDWTPNNLSAIIDYGDNVTSLLSAGAPTSVLDSDLANSAQIVYGNGAYHWTVTFSNPIPITSSVVCHVGITEAASYFYYIQINDATSTQLPGSASTPHDVTLNLGGASTLSKLKFYGGFGAGAGASLYYIKVDGKIIYTGSLSRPSSTVVDSPTNGDQEDTGVGGEVVGNYATLDPNISLGTFTITNGNLKGTTAAASSVAVATKGVTSGKWYWEVTPEQPASILMVGVVDLDTADGWSYNRGASVYYYRPTGDKWGGLAGNTSGTAYGDSYNVAGVVIGVALDMDAGNVTFYKDNVSQGVANTVSLLGKTMCAAMNGAGASEVEASFNFGQQPFKYTAPAGFKALCSTNIDGPDIPLATLTFADNTNLGDPFTAGVDVVQSDNNAAGTIQSVDAGANQMVVSGSGWGVGEYVETKDPFPVIGQPETSTIVNVTGNVLTLTDDTDLNYFSVGDVVQSEAFNGFEARYVPSGSSSTAPITGMDDDTFYALPASSQIPDGKEYGTAENNPTLGSDNFPNYANGSAGWVVIKLGEVTSEGQVKMNPGDGAQDCLSSYSSDGINWSSPTITSSLTLPIGTKWAAQWRATNQVYFINPVSSGFAAVNSITTARITAIDDTVPSITTNGGSWSGSDGSGDPGGETTVKGPERQLDVTANLIFDGQGNVTGMTSAPVPYVNMDNKFNPQLIFGNDLGTGQPPDTELPAGTSIQTTAKAFNTEGESIVSSNAVIPGGTTRASGPGVQEDNSQEFLTTAASIITHDERVVVHEAAKLQSQVQQHQQQLTDLEAQMKKAAR